MAGVCCAVLQEGKGRSNGMRMWCCAAGRQEAQQWQACVEHTQVLAPRFLHASRSLHPGSCMHSLPLPGKDPPHYRGRRCHTTRARATHHVKAQQLCNVKDVPRGGNGVMEHTQVLASTAYMEGHTNHLQGGGSEVGVRPAGGVRGRGEASRGGGEASRGGQR